MTDTTRPTTDELVEALRPEIMVILEVLVGSIEETHDAGDIIVYEEKRTRALRRARRGIESALLARHDASESGAICEFCDEPTPDRLLLDADGVMICALCSHDELLRRLGECHDQDCRMLDSASDPVCSCGCHCAGREGGLGVFLDGKLLSANLRIQEYPDQIGYSIGRTTRAADNHDASTEQSPWRPIETAPKDGTDILAVWVGGGFEEGYGPEIVAWDVERKLWVNESGEDYMPPTHWTPIPSLPVPDTPTEKE